MTVTPSSAPDSSGRSRQCQAAPSPSSRSGLSVPIWRAITVVDDTSNRAAAPVPLRPSSRQPATMAATEPSRYRGTATASGSADSGANSQATYSGYTKACPETKTADRGPA